MKKRNSSGKYIAGLILLIALCVFGAFITTKGITKKKIGRASNIELGLDLAGGVSITYEGWHILPYLREIPEAVGNFPEHVRRSVSFGLQSVPAPEYQRQEPFLILRIAAKAEAYHFRFPL